MKMMIVVRKDLNMRKGKMIAQGAHAAVEAAITCSGKEMMKWYKEGQKKIAVSVDSEDELVKIYENAIEHFQHAVIITDAGHTEFDGVPTKTAVAIGPGEDENIDLITGHLPLL